MAHPMLDYAAPRPTAGRGDAWCSIDECAGRVPFALRPWLEEPGLLTARVRATCGPATGLRLLKLEPAPIEPEVMRRLGVEDPIGLVREIEITCGATRWIFAQSIFPQSTVLRHPWLRDLGDNGLGESLSAIEDVRREPLEYAELRHGHDLAIAAQAGSAPGPSLWARRAVYRLAGWPILVQEVFLPGLGHCGPSTSGDSS
jgi:chorismate--pyruvate lyase